ncbi:hypothetical protein Pla175_31340 [Pirellulimonas nuda]|uniref:PEP-CTERM protein-sorting domain-containing protein n=2 Tax=Pirellulimonas nuda TaxID=2528009 RepID=A0A518DE44_9BACT|nr:hypothetical protein Pla175_31340 [Pirellulimonas nuda]
MKSRPAKTVWFTIAIASMSTIACVGHAQTPVPVSVVGSGTGAFLSAVPTDFADLSGTGTFSFGGLSLPYELTSGDVGGLMITNPGPPIVGDFSNLAAVVFSTPSGDIAMDYAGQVTLTPVDATNLTGVFIATFVPIVGSGTGVFSGVVGGQFEMTAIVAEPFVPRTDPTQIDGFSLDIPYTWSTTGGGGDFFTVVPEPSSLATAGLAAFPILAVRSRGSQFSV